jgi:nucleotide-binding universal stress UspA family protein
MATQTAPAQVLLKNVLYATDFSAQSAQALPYAIAIARKYHSNVFAAHVISLSPFPKSSLTVARQAIAGQAVREAKVAMAAVEPQFKDTSHELVIRKGDIWEELSAIISQNEIDLIVLGTHGRSGVSKVLMGSVAEKIFRRAPCPVLTVGPRVCGEPGTIADLHSILYATDFSPASLAAAPYAISLAQENQARLYLLDVTKGDADEVPEADLKTALRNLIPPRTELSCDPKTLVESGEPAQKILDLAEELAMDLIILGVKPAPAPHLGMSTAYKVVTLATCPVLTLRAMGGAASAGERTFK